MQFVDVETGNYIELHIVKNCDFWANKDGDIYSVNKFTGICYLEKPETALMLILQRRNSKIDSFFKSPFKSHEEKYLKKYLPQ